MRQTVIVLDAHRPLGEVAAALINEPQAQGTPVDTSIAGCPIGTLLGDILPEAAGGLAAAMLGTEIQMPIYPAPYSQEVRR